MGTQKRRGAEILLEILRSEGTRYIFGNPGTTELPLIDALIVNPDFRYVWGLQEATVVSMADGYSQASGKPAFVNLHTSGGLGHGMGAIMNAKIARVPMVITAGQQDLRHILADPLLAADLVQIAAPAAKWCFEPNSLDDLPLILRRAFHNSVTPPRGPAFLSLPMNILDQMGSPRLLPPSRIELSSVGVGVKELAAGLLKFDRFPESIEFYHISEDANDLGYNDAPKLGIFGNVRATLEALADELELKVSPAAVKQNVEIAQKEKETLWRGLMNQADAAADGDGRIPPIVAAREVLRPLPDGFLLVDEALCANPFTQPMHRSTGGRQYFHNRGGGLGWGMPADQL